MIVQRDVSVDPVCQRSIHYDSNLSWLQVSVETTVCYLNSNFNTQKVV